jgi:5-methylcytosine-specific restriction protein B
VTEYELGIKLREMYDNSPKGEAVAHIHLFGIEYADEIRANNYRSVNIIGASGISKSYFAEIDKGR